MQITQAELEVMNVLWRTPGLAASDVASRLATSQDWTVKTVKTLLTRLVDKGALTTSPDGRRFLYHPAVDEADYRSSAAGQFVDKVFAGRAAPLVSQLADARGLSEEDIQELESLLERLKS